MNKTQRKTIESKIIQAVLDVLKASDAKSSIKLEKVVKASAKAIAKKLAKESEKPDVTKGVKTVSVLKKPLVKKARVTKKDTAAKKKRADLEKK